MTQQVEEATVPLVAGVRMDKVKPEAIAGAFARLEIDAPEAVADQVRDLVGFYKEAHRGSLFKCTNCGGFNVREDDHCPFCGAVLKDDEDPADVTTTAPKATPKEKRRASPSSKVAVEAAAKPELARPVPTPEMTKPPKAPETVEIADGVELVALGDLTEKDLDEAVEHVKKIAGEILQDTWLLGDAAKRIFDGQLWRLRLGEDGKPRYRGFNQFCEQELGFSARWTYLMMDVASYFDRGEVGSVGTKKLQLILTAPETHREHLIDKAKQGASRLDIEREIQRIKSQRAQAQSQARPTGADPTPPAKRTITVSVKPGRKVYDLRKADKDGTRPPVEIALESDVMLVVEVFKAKGGDKVAVEFKRA